MQIERQRRKLRAGAVEHREKEVEEDGMHEMEHAEMKREERQEEQVRRTGRLRRAPSGPEVTRSFGRDPALNEQHRSEDFPHDHGVTDQQAGKPQAPHEVAHLPLEPPRQGQSSGEGQRVGPGGKPRRRRQGGSCGRGIASGIHAGISDPTENPPDSTQTHDEVAAALRRHARRAGPGGRLAVPTLEDAEVPGAGLEPTSLSARASKTLVSANSTTRAFRFRTLDCGYRRARRKAERLSGFRYA